MQLTFLKSKIHRATVTAAELHYQGSITIDTVLMRAAGLGPYEKVQVVNVNNGERFETYVIPGKPRSGRICLNGPAARLCAVGDLVIVIAYAQLDLAEVAAWRPVVVHVDAKNRVTRTRRLTA
jgi:aspartate 1-decarboxylase